MNNQCPHADESRGCYNIRCQLGKVCIEPHPAPVQPETQASEFSDHAMGLADTYATASNEGSGPEDWITPRANLDHFLRTSQSVQPQSEPVAVAVPCDYATRDGRLNGVNVTLVLLGNDKEIAAGEIALYAGAAPVAPEQTPRIPDRAWVSDAPSFLNTNDKALWATGWNACRNAAMKGTS